MLVTDEPEKGRASVAEEGPHSGRRPMFCVHVPTMTTFESPLPATIAAAPTPDSATSDIVRSPSSPSIRLNALLWPIIATWIISSGSSGHRVLPDRSVLPALRDPGR